MTSSFQEKKNITDCSVNFIELKTSGESLAGLLTCDQVEKSQTCNHWEGFEQTSSLFHWVCLLARGAPISKWAHPEEAGSQIEPASESPGAPAK